MDQDLSLWLQKHQTEIRSRWREAAQETGLVSEMTLEGLAQERASVLRLVSFLDADRAPDRDWVDALTQELPHSEIVALFGLLRQALLETLTQHAEPQRVVEYWKVVGRRIDQIGLTVADDIERRLHALDAERLRWQTLFNLTRELGSSIDLSYVLQNAIRRIMDAVDAERGAVLLLDVHTNQMTPRAVKDWPDVSLDLADLPPDWQRGHGSAHILKADEAQGSSLKALVHDTAETVAAAPLLANGRLHGMLVVAVSGADGFGPPQRDLLDAAANSLASNLGSSEVIQTLNDQARELGMMLRQQQEESSKREAILASIADGVVFNDRRGRIFLVNRAAELILGNQADDLIGRDLQSLFDLFAAGPQEDILQAIKAVLSNPQALVPPDTSPMVFQINGLTINVQWSPVITEQREFLGIVSVLRNITKEVEADRAKSEFVSTVSHELRTPMTAIKGYADLLHGGMVGEVNENQKRFLGIIRNNADRLTALISDLLDINRVETGRVRFEPEAVQVGDIIKSVVDALAPNAENKGHTLSFSVEAGLPEIMGDPVRLYQVFTNLVGNAINYTPEGGKVSVDVYSVGGAIRADVKDTGIGIRAGDLGKIFERFYRADHPLVQESRGTGLGLPIVKLFVEMHGGRVWAASEEGKGSTFTLLLPLPTTQLEEILEPISPAVIARLEQRHVLVADDDPDIAELVKLHLEKAGFRVTVVGRGVKVLEVSRRQCPDLIVLDILLPDMDGRAVLETLKSEPATADIPVVMLTVLADDGTAFDLGAADHLTKPIEEAELLEAIETALSRRGRILVVEDDVDTIEMMRMALRRVGYNVDIAADGYEALSLARRWRPQAILLDLRLPGMDGYETLAHLKRSLDTQGIPIVVTSAHVADPEKDIKRLKSMGVVSFLSKPFTVNQLVAEIDQVTNTVRRTVEGDANRPLL